MKIFKFKTIRVMLMATTIFSIIVMSTSVSASLFFRTGKIVRAMSNTTSYGGCMVLLDTNISNGCPDKGWVSLDCKGQFSAVDDGKRAYASALVAFSLGKRVSIQVDNLKKINGFCIGKRLDILN